MITCVDLIVRGKGHSRRLCADHNSVLNEIISVCGVSSLGAFVEGEKTAQTVIIRVDLYLESVRRDGGGQVNISAGRLNHGGIGITRGGKSRIDDLCRHKIADVDLDTAHRAVARSKGTRINRKRIVNRSLDIYLLQGRASVESVLADFVKVNSFGNRNGLKGSRASCDTVGDHALQLSVVRSNGIGTHLDK